MRMFNDREQWLDYVSAQTSKVLVDAGYLGPTTDFVEIRRLIKRGMIELEQDGTWGAFVGWGGIRLTYYPFEDGMTDFNVSIDIGSFTLYTMEEQEDGVVMGVENGPDDYSMV